jgi:hypothetical protein
MAYMSQERKAERAPMIRAICKKYGVKASLSVKNHSTLVLTVKSGQIDFIGNYNTVANPATPAEHDLSVNPYWFKEQFDGTARDFLTEVAAAMKGDDYFDKSDSQSDYFHCSHYIAINIGKWNKAYVLAK